MRHGRRLSVTSRTVALALILTGCSDAPPRPSTTAASSPAAATPPRRIDSFAGPYRFLSNFWPAEVHYEGVVYPTAEHAYQSAKTLDRDERRRIAALPTPSEAKRAGRALKPRPDWERVRIDVMAACVRDKFTRSAELRRRLVATGDAELIEGNSWGDRFWGVCDGEGENHLGRILTRVREELRE